MWHAESTPALSSPSYSPSPLRRLPRGPAGWRAEDHPDSPSVNSHVFLDETKRADCVIAAVTVTDTDAIRKSFALWRCQVSGRST